MGILDKRYIVTMPNGEEWSIPVSVIAVNRAAYYAPLEFDGDVDKSLEEDTAPLFESHEYEIKDWAKNNMNWSEVENFAVCVVSKKCDFDDGWINGDIEIS